MNLEKKVCKNNAFYIDSIDRDFDNQRLTFRFLVDPEKNQIVRVLAFDLIEQFEEFWDEEFDPLLIEQLIGIIENQKKDGIVEYWIRLQQSEMHFFTRATPQVADVPF